MTAQLSRYEFTRGPAFESGPTKDKPQAVSAALGSKGQGNTHASIVSDSNSERKAFATLQAQFSLKGYALLRLAEGVMLAERWGFTRQLDTMTQAAQFLHQIGGAR